MPILTAFKTYLCKLGEARTEDIRRSALEWLLNQFTAETTAKALTIQHEPKRESGKGAPDFKISHRGVILGYIEVKGIGSILKRP